MPNGYSLYKRSKGGLVIVDGNSKSRLEVINPDIQRLSVLGDLVVGEAREVKEIDGYITPGKYFLLDTKTKSSKEGLTMNELKNLLANRYGVSEVPKLKKTSRY